MTQLQNQPDQKSEQDLFLLERSVKFEAPGFKFHVDELDTWQTIFMILVLILGVYGGIRLLNWLIP